MRGRPRGPPEPPGLAEPHVSAAPPRPVCVCGPGRGVEQSRTPRWGWAGPGRASAQPEPRRPHTRACGTPRAYPADWLQPQLRALRRRFPEPRGGAGPASHSPSRPGPERPARSSAAPPGGATPGTGEARVRVMGCERQAREPIITGP